MYTEAVKQGSESPFLLNILESNRDSEIEIFKQSWKSRIHRRKLVVSEVYTYGIIDFRHKRQELMNI